MKIWKYELRPSNGAKIKMPTGASPLTTGLDPNGTPCIWCAVDDMAPLRFYEVIVAVTGGSAPLGEHICHVGHFVKGDFVGHVFFNHQHFLQP